MDIPSWKPWLRRHRLDDGYLATVERLVRPLCDWLGRRRKTGLFVLGICGAQGSGKSTLAHALAHACARSFGWRCAVMSLDDLYLPGYRRQQLACEVHPLLRTRGVPGTHDVELGMQVIAALRAARPCRLPRFDKAQDEPQPLATWPQVRRPVELLLFEGWCLGLPPEERSKLRRPVNALEREEDADGHWREFVQRQLRHGYPPLFREIDALVYLQAPDWTSVCRWRARQEAALPATQRMSATELARFMQHFERLTRHGWRVMPRRADAVATLGQDQRVRSLRFRDSQHAPACTGGHGTSP